MLRPLRPSFHLGIALALAAALTGCDSGLTELRTTPPEESPYPEAPVDILVDEMGVSHVYAQSDADAFFGSGYAMARDRLFHMELFRRRALGRSAELFGESHREGDIGARAFAFGRMAALDLARLRQERPDDAKLIEAWVAGINHRIEEVASGAAPRPYGMRDTELDFVPEKWTPEHAMAIGKMLSFGMSSTLEYELLATVALRMSPDVVTDLPFMMPSLDVYTTGAVPAPTSGPAPKPVLPPPLDVMPDVPWKFQPVTGPFASNNWAVAGALTDNGKPMLAGDPHQALTSPSRFWPVHINSAAGGGTIDVVGFSFIGVPGVQLGHNAHLGWTTTTNFADATDLLEVQAGSDCSAAEISVGGHPFAVEARTETILVRGDGAVGTGSESQVTIRSVPGVGVILPDEILPAPRAFIADGCLLFAWTGFEPSIEAAAYLGMDRATNLDEFESAVDLLEVGAANFIAAHPEDGITYHVNARVPDRGDPTSRPMPWRVVSGDDPENLWSRGDLPPSKLPRWRNPERGYLTTANNDPWGFTANGSVEDDPYYYGTFYANGFRAHRIEELIQEKTASGAKMTREGMMDVQRDVRWALADAVVPMIDQAIADLAANDPALAEYANRPELATLAQRLGAWDRRLSRDQAAPVIFNAVSWFAAKRIFEPAYTSLLFETIHEFKPGFFMGALYNVLAGRYTTAAQYVPDSRLLLLGALSDTAAWLTTRFGSIDAAYTWGDVHLAEFPTDFGGELSVEPFAIDGGDETVAVAPTPFFQDGEVRETFGCTQASLYRMVLGFADDGTPEAVVNFARGTSEDPASPHFDDRDPAWAAIEYEPLLFRRADVEAKVTERQTLEAKK